MPGLTAPESALLISRFADHELFARESLRIRHKNGAMIPMILQPAQVKLNKAIRKQRRAGLPVRICYLKAGQVMVSAGTAAQNFHAVPFMPGRHCLAIADSAAHADLVFNYYKGYQDNYVPFTGGIDDAQVTLPELINDRDETLKWANDSFIQIATGRNVHVGRAHPWQMVQISEFGFQEGGATLMDGLMQRVPRSPETMVIVESTGFGEGGPFYELCQRAQNPQLAGDWLFLFFGWHEHPEYEMPVPGGDRGAFQRDLDRGEIEIMQQYGLSLEKMAWRRWCILNNCEGKVATFQQEFPINPRECFQSSSHTYLDLGALERCSRVEEPMRGELQIHQVGPERRVQFQQKEGGTLSIYRVPKKAGRYTIGADSAQGKDPEAKKGGRSDPDYASASVIDADTGEQVAKFSERVTEAHFGRIVYALGWYYNWAYVVPETVGAGRAFLQALLALEYPTDRIYRKQRPAGDMRPVLFNELGYDTNSVTRPQLLSALDTALLEGSITIHDGGTNTQCRTLVRDADGKVAAKLGAHDDDVFSHALAVIGLRHIPKAPTMSAAEQQKQWQPQFYGPKRRNDDD